jgi:hypothetical protein
VKPDRKRRRNNLGFMVAVFVINSGMAGMIGHRYPARM